MNAILSNPDLIIRVRNGSGVLEKGKLPSGTVRDITSLLEEKGCSNAWIHFYTGSRKSAKFSSNIPKQLHQKIRNIWMS